MTYEAVGLLLALVLTGTAAFIWWRYPGFRRAFIEHWQPASIAQRMDDWAARHRRPKTEADAIVAIRAHMRALGVPVDDLTDEELQQRIRALFESVRAAGIPAQEAMRRMQKSLAALESAGRQLTPPPS